jgi:probable F420-dependent oxidoreductase
VIEVGLTLPNYRATATPSNILATAERADALGFHSVWVADHIAIPVEYTSTMGSLLFETHTTLTFVAARTTRLKLGCSVMPTPYRHPLLQARTLATLDQLSGGRVIYGGAAGYMVDEFRALGVDFSRRASMTDEYLRVLKLAWTEPVINFHGQFVDCTNVTCDPKPQQKPHPPIWLGGDSDGAFRRIVRYADGWHGLAGGSPGARRVDPTVDDFASRIGRLHEISEEEGRDPSSITLSLKASCQIGPDDSRPLHGSVSKIVDTIKRLEALGVSLVVLAPNLFHEPTPLEVVDQIASEILTRLN